MQFDLLTSIHHVSPPDLFYFCVGFWDKSASGFPCGFLAEKLFPAEKDKGNADNHSEEFEEKESEFEESEPKSEARGSSSG